MNRRGFLGAILALGCAPAIVKAASLMPVRVYDGPCIVTIDQSLFRGGLGQYDGVRLHELTAREAAKEKLAVWLQEQLDESAFRCLTAPNRWTPVPTVRHEGEEHYVLLVRNRTLLDELKRG